MSKQALPQMDKQKAPIKQDPPMQPEPTVAKLSEIKVEVVAVNVPFVTATQGYESRRCDLGSLTGEQARKLNAIRRGYDYSGTKLANGGDIKSLADAVKALLDSIEI